mgnify:FL=1
MKVKKLNKFILRGVLPRPEKDLIVIAANEDEALLMRGYLLEEGFES